MSGNFNALHTALEASVNALLLTGCLQVDLVMSPNYSVDETGQIAGASYRVECVRPAALADPTTTITWDQECIGTKSYVVKLQGTQCASVQACSEPGGQGVCVDGDPELVCKSETP